MTGVAHIALTKELLDWSSEVELLPVALYSRLLLLLLNRVTLISRPTQTTTTIIARLCAAWYA
jgi:hypothetical protein